MFTYPDINPIALQIGSIKIRWYGVMYLVGFAAAWGLASIRARRPHSGWDQGKIADLIFYSILGLLLGARIVYMLVYAFPMLIAHPLTFFKIWDGGMSFHGGLLGIAIALWLYGRTIGKSFFEMADFIAPLAPIGLGAGRIGNFINGELWGRVTNMPWGMVYPWTGPQARHPSEIYEFLLEGVLMFFILWFYSEKPRPRMAVSGLFLLLYGVFRSFAECFRQPDAQLGFYFSGWLTMGQILSIPMILIGAFLLFYAYRRKNKAGTP